MADNPFLLSRPPIGGFWVWDVQTDRVAGCSGLVEFFGFTEKEAGRGLAIGVYMQRIALADRERVVSAIRKAVTTRERFCETYRVDTGERGLRLVRATGRCQYDGEGHATFFPGWFLDLSGATLDPRDEALQFARRLIQQAQAIVHATGDEVLEYLMDNLLEEIGQARDYARATGGAVLKN